MGFLSYAVITDDARYRLSSVLNDSIDVVTVFVTGNLVNYFKHKQQQYVLQHGFET